jgi:uracil-DNA glycosylase
VTDARPTGSHRAFGAREPSPLESLLTEIRACRLCEASLPLGPRPVLRASATATLLIAGQAPGTLVHGSGVPWDDASGVRLRGWLGLDKATFYDESKIAIVPMGFCYPGRGASGDLPPRPECRATWHPRLLPLLPAVKLVLAIGQYAQAHFLGDRRRKTLTDTVAAWRDYAPPAGPGDVPDRVFPLPHPSPRNVAWFVHNPWFEADVLPALRAAVATAVAP